MATIQQTKARVEERLAARERELSARITECYGQHMLGLAYARENAAERPDLARPGPHTWLDTADRARASLDDLMLARAWLASRDDRWWYRGNPAARFAEADEVIKDCCREYREAEAAEREAIAAILAR